ncbi:hypothetical protein MTBBW1_1770027 [Desulfamplus magnetovallimortis]|uniref:Uncharacterized protein n=1 Tax=Desulfamplus magnetovallimortis TaxID=1246637 RepID=A0A1W1HAA9_9BACT|nr:hypothetical protein MTBBW1_1770027 [Desulfamplus magnetovallimortis]
MWRSSAMYVISIQSSALSKLKIRVRLIVETRHALSLRCR